MQRIPAGYRWRGHLPNLLSVMRLVLAAIFPWAGPEVWAWAIILAAGSDLADGLLARWLGTASVAGGHVDAAADKIFVITALVTFLVDGRLEAWQIACLLPRDITVGLIAIYAVTIRRWDAFALMSARWPGKMTTALMFLFLMAMVLPTLEGAKWPVLAVTSVSSVFAGTDYRVQFLRARATDQEGRPTEVTSP